MQSILLNLKKKFQVNYFILLNIYLFVLNFVPH